jgi:hypothetical protein
LLFSSSSSSSSSRLCAAPQAIGGDGGVNQAVNAVFGGAIWFGVP